MVNKRGREGASTGARLVTKFFFSSFTRCSRRSSLYVDGLLDDKRHVVMFVLALRRLRRSSFVFLSSKFLTWCFNAFRCALFALSGFFAI